MTLPNRMVYDIQTMLYAVHDPQVGINFHIQGANGAAIMETKTRRLITVLREMAADGSYSKEARDQYTNEANRLEQELYGND